MVDRHAETMADIAELLAHGYDDASDDHNWMMAQSIYDELVASKVTWRNAYNATVENARRAEAELRRTRTVLVDALENHPFPLDGGEVAMTAAWFITRIGNALTVGVYGPRESDDEGASDD